MQYMIQYVKLSRRCSTRSRAVYSVLYNIISLNIE